MSSIKRQFNTNSYQVGEYMSVEILNGLRRKCNIFCQKVIKKLSSDARHLFKCHAT